MKKRLNCARLALLTVGLLWLAPAPVFCRAQETSAPAAASPQPQTQAIPLEYRELNYTTVNWGIQVTAQPSPFKKEPAVGQRNVFRGTLKFGNSSDHFVPFIWDRNQGKLYLDLNRNQDLTDDAKGVFSCLGGSRNLMYQDFPDVRLTFKTPAGIQQALVELSLNFYGNAGLPNVAAGARYCWEGKVSQPGREWQVMLIDNLSGKIGSAESGSLVVRPWADRARPIDSQYGSAEYFSLPQNLFFGGQAYQVTCAPAPQDNGFRYQLVLKEYPEQLGEVKIAGKYLKRLILTRGAGTVPGRNALRQGSGASVGAAQSGSLVAVLDQPEAVVKVPAGSYTYSYTLGQGGMEAHLLPQYSQRAQSTAALVVTAAAAVTLKEGGPLTNTVTASRRGRELTLNYRLVGANGQAYELQGARKEPTFAIYRTEKTGDKLLASGKFQFG